MRIFLQFVRAVTSVGSLAAPALFAGALIVSDPAPAAVATTSVGAFVQESVDKGYSLLKDKSISDAERHAQFSAFMQSVSDMRRIGIFALGKYGSGLSKSDTEAYVAAFTYYAIPVYEAWLSKYNERTLKITGVAQRAADDFVVSADAVSTTNPAVRPFKVSFRVRETADGRLIVADMTAEGISLALTLRADFTAFLQQHGDRLPDLIARLKGQTETANSSVASATAAH